MCKHLLQVAAQVEVEPFRPKENVKIETGAPFLCRGSWLYAVHCVPLPCLQLLARRARRERDGCAARELWRAVRYCMCCVHFFAMIRLECQD